MLKRMTELQKKLGAPYLTGQIYCVGRNYIDHAKELGNPVPSQPLFFQKNVASLKAVGEDNEYLFDDKLHYEAELVIMVGKHLALGSTVKDESFICGFMLGLDLTRREVQSQLKAKGHPWMRAKSFEGSAILGPLVKSDSVVADIDFALDLNGECRQDTVASNMIFDATQLANSLLQLTSLYEGDIIFTGTPEGVGEIKRGDSFTLRSKVLSYKTSAKI